jgi:hypothetical protein
VRSSAEIIDDHQMHQHVGKEKLGKCPLVCNFETIARLQLQTERA